MFGKVAHRSVRKIFDQPDDIKFRSSLTLFGTVSPGEVFDAAAGTANTHNSRPPDEAMASGAAQPSRKTKNSPAENYEKGLRCTAEFVRPSTEIGGTFVEPVGLSFQITTKSFDEATKQLAVSGHGMRSYPEKDIKRTSTCTFVPTGSQAWDAK